MKRALAFTLMVLAIMIIAVSCDEPHVHSFSNEWTSDTVYHWHASACGHEEEVSDKEEHKWKDGDEDGWKIDVASTETEEGKKHRECSVCGYNEEGKVPLKGHVHTYSSYGKDSSKHWRTCTGCGETFTYSHTFSYASVDGTNHCQECYCGYSENTEAHSYAGGVQKVSGTKVYNVCDKCKYEKEANTTASTTAVSTAAKTEKIQTTTTVGGKEVVAGTLTMEVATTAAGTAVTSSTDGQTTEGTTVKFPEGALKVTDGAEEISLIINAAPAAVASSESYQGGTTVVTTDDGAVVAAFEFKLEGADTSNLSGTKGDTEITTYVAKGLDGTSGDTIYTTNGEDGTTSLGTLIEIKYIGTDSSDAKITRYENGTGKLTFTVSHFSKYAIVAEKIVATDDKGKMYTSLEDEETEQNTVKGAISSVADGGTITLLKDVKLSKSIEFNQTVTINLNGKTVTIKNFEKETDVIWLLNKNTSYSVGFVDGTIKTESETKDVAKVNMLFCVGNNATLNLTNVTTNTCAAYGIYCEIAAFPATVNIAHCTLEGFYAYGVGTNATKARDTFINLTITDSTITTKNATTLDNTGLLVNIPGKVVIKNSVISGDRQGIILRGTGSDVVNIIDSTINVTAAGTVNEGNAAEKGTCHYADRTTTWTSGNEVALAALVIGNSESTKQSYQSETAVDLRDVTINLCENYKGKHIWVTQASGDYKVVVSGEDDNSWTTNEDMHGATYFGCSTWDGTADYSWYTNNGTANTFTLTAASQLAGLADLVKKGNSFSGKTVSLANDIDLGNKEWEPIGLYKDTSITEGEKKPFSGTFDGNGHDIVGLKITAESGNPSYRALFGYVNGTITNLTVKGEVTARDSAGVVAALGDGGKLSNVDNYVNVTAGTNIIESEEQYSQAKVAGLVVAVKNGDTGCEITNCKNYGKIKSEQTEATDAVGGILAWSNVKNLTITGCENHGTVTAGTKQNAGGIIGEVAPVDGTTTHEITLTGCTNNETISTTDGKAGGIIGRSTIKNTELKLEDCTSTNTTNLIGQGTYTNVSET